MNRKYIIELDDFGELKYADLLDSLDEYFDDFKITLFTIPDLVDKKFKEFVAERDYLKLGVHGWNHHWEECLNWSYEEAVEKLEMSQKLCFRFYRVFRAPRWQINLETRKALDDLDFILADHPSLMGFDLLPRKRYFHNTDLTELPNISNKFDVIKAHGHINSTMPNDLSLCLKQLYSLPKDTSFLFFHELPEFRGEA